MTRSLVVLTLAGLAAWAAGCTRGPAAEGGSWVPEVLLAGGNGGNGTAGRAEAGGGGAAAGGAGGIDQWSRHPGGSGGRGGTAAGGGGSGGPGGVPGSGGEANSMDRSTEPWLLDPTKWTALPQDEVWGEPCRAFEWTAGELPFPPVAWEPCGPGCMRADVVQGYGFTASPVLSTSTLDGGIEKPYLLVAHVVPGTTGRWQKVFRVVDLDTGRSLGAVKYDSKKGMETAPCFDFDSYRRTALQISVGRSTADAPIHALGTFSPVSGTWDWKLPFEPNLPDTKCRNAFMEDGGKWFFFCNGAPRVRAMLTSGSSTITPVFDQDDGWLPNHGTVFADLLVWSELDAMNPGSRIRASRSDGLNPFTVVERLPLDTCKIHVTATRIGGVMGYGQGCSAGQAEARFWSVTRGQPDSPVSESPVLHQEALLSSHSSMSGDFIASTFGTWTQKAGFVIARISDWNLRRLPSPEGFSPVYFTLANEKLYLAYTPLGKDKGRITEVLQIDLAWSFDDIGVPYVGDLPSPR